MEFKEGLMEILVAEDDKTSRRLLEVSLARSGYGVVSVEDGRAAWEILQKPDPPRLVILDWMMPGRDGIDVCRDLRSQQRDVYIDVMLVTTKIRGTGSRLTSRRTRARCSAILLCEDCKEEHYPALSTVTD